MHKESDLRKGEEGRKGRKEKRREGVRRKKNIGRMNRRNEETPKQRVEGRKVEKAKQTGGE